MEHGSIGVYIHVPYCRVACPYCDFVKKGIQEAAPEAFAEALCREIGTFEGPRTAASLSFGGGTPSLLTPRSLERIFEALRERFDFLDPEISLEANPDDVTEDVLRHWRALGVNRVTVGVQSFNDEVLRYLGRCHDSGTARSACTAVAGHFDNWGVDLIFGAPPLDGWKTTLAECRNFRPPHISSYSLTYEERTPFWNRRDEAIDSDDSLELYRTGRTFLSEYDHYEISNFALEGYRSRHNRIYWRNGEYAGFGPGAYSFVQGIRGRNNPHIGRYLEQPGAKVERLELTDLEIRQETLIQHFRAREGIAKGTYEARFGRALREDYGPVLDGLVHRGLLAEDATRFYPTVIGF